MLWGLVISPETLSLTRRDTGTISGAVPSPAMGLFSQEAVLCLPEITSDTLNASSPLLSWHIGIFSVPVPPVCRRLVLLSVQKRGEEGACGVSVMGLSRPETMSQ
jgi:hypothetical protein